MDYKLEFQSLSETISHSILQEHSIIVSNLPENNEYSFKVFAVNAVGNVSSTRRRFCKLCCFRMVSIILVSY